MPRYLFVTGKLAAQALRNTVDAILPPIPYDIAVLPISVAALMDTRFISMHLKDSHGCDAVLIPGLCPADIKSIAEKLGVPVFQGPRQLQDLPVYFGKSSSLKGFGTYAIKIIAEIADAYALKPEEILARANYFKSCGADIIDLGCPVTGGFPEIASVVGMLKAEGFSVSVDSFDSGDIVRADQAGVDYVLSINSSNIDLARHLHCRNVVVPDFDQGMDSLERTIARMEDWHLPYIIDPILKPIGTGFADSLEQLLSIRRKYPDAEMLTGLGNLTELTDADSTGINALMTGLCEELRIHYILTTEVVSWAKGAVRELDAARRLMHFACKNHVPPKHLDDGLITVKDPPFTVFTERELRAMQKQLKDSHFRIFTDKECMYVFNAGLFIKGNDAQSIFNQLGAMESSQAFYLGKELQKAVLAIKLGKRYVQDEDLRWGYLS